MVVLLTTRVRDMARGGVDRQGNERGARNASASERKVRKTGGGGRDRGEGREVQAATSRQRRQGRDVKAEVR